MVLTTKWTFFGKVSLQLPDTVFTMGPGMKDTKGRNSQLSPVKRLTLSRASRKALSGKNSSTGNCKDLRPTRQRRNREDTVQFTFE